MTGNRCVLTGVFAAIASFASVARAADVSFDTVGGDDANDGASETTPKKTVKITQGAAVHIKRGSSYTGNLNLNDARVSTYGCGARVLVDGSLTLTNSSIEGLHARPENGSAINVQSGSSIRGGHPEYQWQLRRRGDLFGRWWCERRGRSRPSELRRPFSDRW